MTEHEEKIFLEGRAQGLEEAVEVIDTARSYDESEAKIRELSVASVPFGRYGYSVEDVREAREKGQAEGRSEVAMAAQQMFQDMAKEEDRATLLETWALIRAGGFMLVPVAGLRTLMGSMNDAFQREGLRRPSQAAEARKLLQGWLEGKLT